MSIKLSDFSEEVRYVWDCPLCGYCNEQPDDPNYEESCYCENCKESSDIEDDINWQLIIVNKEKRNDLETCKKIYEVEEIKWVKEI